jgi:hypothetical protein
MTFRSADLKLSAKFKAELEHAFAQPTFEDKRAAMKQLFDDYGYVFQTEIDLGGMCVTVSTVQTSTEVRSFLTSQPRSQFSLLVLTRLKMTQEKFESTLTTRITRAAGPGSGDATFSTGSSTNSVDTKINQDERYTFTCKVLLFCYCFPLSCTEPFRSQGGNPLLTTTISKWIPTVADYRTWRVIKTSKVISVLDLLDPETRRKIEPLAPEAAKPLRGR